MRLLRLILLGVVLAGCAEAPPMIYPVTIGSHVPAREEKKYRIVVWATDSSIASTITSAAQSNIHPGPNLPGQVSSPFQKITYA
jgi:hypothetical protein